MAAIDKILTDFKARPNPFPGTSTETWYCIASCALASSNAGTWVPNVYHTATENQPAPQRRHILRPILRPISESLLKGAPLYDISRLLNAFYPLAKAVSLDSEMLALQNGAPVLSLRQAASYRDILDHTDRGLGYFRNIYREQFSVDLEYGADMSENTFLSPVETSQVTLGSLLPLDVQTQVKWHMWGLIRNGGSVEQVQYALQIVGEVVDAAEVRLKHGIPDINVVHDDILFK